MTLMTHIIATKPPRSPQIVVKSKGNPFISGKSKLVKYYNLARYICLLYIYIHLRTVCFGTGTRAAAAFSSSLI